MTLERRREVRLVGEINSLLAAHGIEPVSSLVNFRRLPIRDKSNMSDAPAGQWVEVRATSGSTGRSRPVFYSAASVEAFLRRGEACVRGTGVRAEDRCMILFAYGNFVAGSAYERILGRLGVSTIPFGAPTTWPVANAVETIRELKPTVWFSVPSYAVHLLERTSPDAAPRLVVLAGEPLYAAYRDRLRERGIRYANHYGLTECPCVAYAADGDERLAVVADGLIVEQVPGEAGVEIVVTDLHNTAYPMIRFNTHDLCHDADEDNHGFVVRFRLDGRADDILKLRGVSTSKAALREALLAHATEFLVDVEIGEDGVDVLHIHIGHAVATEVQKIEFALKQRFHSRVRFTFHDVVPTPKTRTNKAIMVRDLRGTA